MNELTGELKRPMDRDKMNQDAATLRVLCGDLNNPLITGAEVPPGVDVNEGLPPAQVAISAETPKEIPPPAPPPKPQPQPKRIEVNRFLLTGLPKSGKTFVAEKMNATILTLDDPLFRMARDIFPEDVCSIELLQASPFVADMRAWGEGIINSRFPVTAMRLYLVGRMRSLSQKSPLFGIGSKNFGTPGFWARSLIQRAETIPGKVVVTDVIEPADYSALVKSGFRPYHILASAETRAARSRVTQVKREPAPVDAAIEQDLVRKISSQPKGAGLWAIWNDSVACPSPRLLSLETFLGLIS